MELIPTGTPVVIAQTTIYACPSKVCVVVSSAALEFNTVATTTGFAAQTSTTTTGFTNAYPFVRCTSASPTVSFKPMS